jgi:hypothetical protein
MSWRRELRAAADTSLFLLLLIVAFVLGMVWQYRHGGRAVGESQPQPQTMTLATIGK